MTPEHFQALFYSSRSMTNSEARDVMNEALNKGKTYYSRDGWYYLPNRHPHPRFGFYKTNGLRRLVDGAVGG